MKRDGWQRALDVTIECWRERAFEFGTADCCQFVGECVQAMTGQDRRSLFPDYASEREAGSILAQHGDMLGLLDSAFGDRKPLPLVYHGDVVAVSDGEQLVPGICTGLCAVVMGRKGLCLIRMDTAIAAWSV